MYEKGRGVSQNFKEAAESNSNKQYRRPQKDIYRGSNFGTQHLYTNLAYAPAEAGFAWGAAPSVV